MKIYVGNVRNGVTELALANEFEKFGKVLSVQIPKDSITGKIQGCAFIEMADDNEAQAAIKALDRLEFHGAWLVVRQAR